MKRLNLSFSLVSALIVGSSLTPALAQVPDAEIYPTAGIVEDTVAGDAWCYLTVIDDQGNRYENMGGTFDLCASQDRFINHHVNFEYGSVRVNYHRLVLEFSNGKSFRRVTEEGYFYKSR